MEKLLGRSKHDQTGRQQQATQFCLSATMARRLTEAGPGLESIFVPNMAMFVYICVRVLPFFLHNVERCTVAVVSRMRVNGFWWALH